jgi:glycosyltransferase involved in cell wall biosynthesis
LHCRRFRENCGQCPQKDDIGRFDFTRWNLLKVRQLATSPNVSYIFPSTWIQNEAAGSLQFRGFAAHIPNGFDPRPYRFRKRREARQMLGLPLDQRIVVVSSAALENKVKGVKLALGALSAVGQQGRAKPLTVVIGRETPGLQEQFPAVEMMLTGFIEDRERLGLFYAAADLLLFTSLADNLPITIQEAMAAATPVLAFAVGGVPELVTHEQTGWLVTAEDQAALAQSLRDKLESPSLESTGMHAREHIATSFSSENCVSRHLDLYRKLMQVHGQTSTL